MDGKKHLVVPMSMIVPGVLRGSKGSLFYPKEEVEKNHEAWNGMPITVYHPTVDGRNVSAQTEGILDRQGIGTVMRATANGKLKAEAWIDIDKANKVDSRIVDSIRRGNPVEISTGLFTDNSPAPTGSEHNGRPYNAIARNYRPDHLAILPDQRGACSLMDGCGLGVNQSTENANPEGHKSHALKMADDHITSLSNNSEDLWITYNRNWPKSKRNKLNSKDFAGPDQSFPIQDQTDVDAAAKLTGHAKDPAVVKSRIKAIAKRKGLTVPKSYEVNGGPGSGPHPSMHHPEVIKAHAFILSQSHMKNATVDQINQAGQDHYFNSSSFAKVAKSHKKAGEMIAAAHKDHLANPTGNAMQLKDHQKAASRLSKHALELSKTTDDAISNTHAESAYASAKSKDHDAAGNSHLKAAMSHVGCAEDCVGNADEMIDNDDQDEDGGTIDHGHLMAAKAHTEAAMSHQSVAKMAKNTQVGAGKVNVVQSGDDDDDGDGVNNEEEENDPEVNSGEHICTCGTNNSNPQGHNQYTTGHVAGGMRVGHTIGVGGKDKTVTGLVKKQGITVGVKTSSGDHSIRELSHHNGKAITHNQEGETVDTKTTTTTVEKPIENAQPMTAEQWMAAAPKQIQEIVSNAAAILNEQKTALVEKLTVNLTGDDKTKMTEMLMAKSIDEIRLFEKVAKSAAPVQQVQNHAPVYGPIGKTPLIVDTTANQEDEDVIAMLPQRLDWHAISLENASRGRKAAVN